MNRSPFAAAQAATLLALRKGLPEIRCVLVGAGALACQIDMTWRKTSDLDLTIVADERELAGRLRGLGWRRHDRFEQRWTSEEGVVVDALPAAPASLAEGKIVFSESGHVMSLVGFDLALAHCVAVPLDEETDIDVAAVPVIAVLKMLAWLDRPSERERDLQDIAHILDEYLAPDDLRRWEDALIDAGLPYEDQSAFALGQDVGTIAELKHLAIVDAFVAALLDEASWHNAVFARCFGRSDGIVVADRLNAFRRGLAYAGGEPSVESDE